jgi:YVTN family beta-propeller protein
MFRERAATTSLLALSGLAILCGGCNRPSADVAPALAAAQPQEPITAAPPPPANGLEGMPPLLDPNNVWAATRPGNFSPVVANFPARVYVPNTISNTVSVIDPETFKVIDTFNVGHEPQHVTPSYDLKKLWAVADLGDSATEIDPATGKMGKTIPVKDPYNMYYTPDGRFALVVAEREMRLNFLDPSTMKLVESVPVPCKGVDHMDFSADGTFLIASCEFAGSLLKFDVVHRKPIGTLLLAPALMPQDIRAAPDGKLFYAADMMAHGVHVIDPFTFKKVGFIATGKGAHGISISRDAKVMYVSNRGEGSVSVVDFATRTVLEKWQIPGGGSPDMGGLNADGSVLWLSGRYHHEVYAFDTKTGKLLARIKVGRGPHGLSVYPQPGRYSLGHNGVLR